MDGSAALQEVLVPYDRDWRVDKNVRLRVYCRDKAPGEWVKGTGCVHVKR